MSTTLSKSETNEPDAFLKDCSNKASSYPQTSLK
jgi:hypothetical protein